MYMSNCSPFGITDHIFLLIEKGENMKFSSLINFKIKKKNNNNKGCTLSQMFEVAKLMPSIKLLSPKIEKWEPKSCILPVSNDLRGTILTLQSVSNWDVVGFTQQRAKIN